MRLLFAVALGGASKDDSLEATPLVEDGFMYAADSGRVARPPELRMQGNATVVWVFGL